MLTGVTDCWGSGSLSLMNSSAGDLVLHGFVVDDY